MATGTINDKDNLSHIKFFGIGIPEEGRLATSEDEMELRRLISSVKPIEVESKDEINTAGNKIIMYLLDGNRVEITSIGQSMVEIAQITINHGAYKL